MICLFDQNLSYETWCKCKIKILIPIEKFLNYNISKVGRKEGKNNCSRAKRMSRKKSKMEKIIFLSLRGNVMTSQYFWGSNYP